ncbi:MAG: hypothetical protein JSV77_05210 [Dehalococcoidales bacterium]|nr:MAG: hypothetical protein JSV77_05210 [Dehalococcoidales bacterium]
MSRLMPERKIRCSACEKLYPINELLEHQRNCPEMERLDREIPERGRNLGK